MMSQHSKGKFKFGNSLINISSFIFRVIILFSIVFIQTSVLDVKANNVVTVWKSNSINSALAETFTDCSTVTEIPQMECEALTSIYDSTEGENWTEHTDWLVTDTPCSWYGVGCTDDHISSLELVNNNLSGEIPSEIGNLTNLVNLHFNDNSLSGTLPPEIVNLVNLQEIDISNTEICLPDNDAFRAWLTTIPVQSITGYCAASTPVDIEDILQTQDVVQTPEVEETPVVEEDLEIQELDGAFTDCSSVTEIPETECNALVDIYNAANGAGWTTNTDWLVTDTPCSWFGAGCSDGHVQSLSLSSNNLTGSVPISIGNLTNLGVLYINSNGLSGSLPVEMASLTAMQDIDFADTDVCMPTDEGFQAWIEAVPTKDVTENCEEPTDLPTQDIQPTEEATQGLQLTEEPTPTIEEPQIAEETPVDEETPEVEGQYLSDICTSVTEIPITECWALAGLYDSTRGYNWYNHDSWEDSNSPCSWDGVSCTDGHVTSLELSKNYLSGHISDSFAYLTELNVLDIHNNKNLEGSLPEEMVNMVSMQEINISDTGLCMPSENDFKAWIEAIPTKTVTGYCDEIFTTCMLVSGITSSECYALVDIFELTSGEDWTNNSGWLETASPCSWYGVGCTNGHVTSLVLSNNNLYGALTSTIEKLNQLKVLKLDHNKMGASLPTTFGNLINLEEIDFSSTSITGAFPSTVVNLVNLTTLDFSSSNICILFDDWYQTWLNSIPNRTLGEKYCGSQLFAGCDTIANVSSSDCELLTTLFNETNGTNWNYSYQGSRWFYYNDPCRWGGVTCDSSGSITGLSLAELSIKGKIPTVIGDFISLKSLELYNNQLTGLVPSELGNLVNLTKLLLNKNHLSGILPSELTQLTKLRTFNILDTNLCFPVNEDFQNWFANMTTKNLTSSCSENAYTGCSNVSGIPESECEALDALYISSNGYDWKDHSDWFTTNTPCSWYGISCSEGHVQRLVLSENNLTGSLPSELGDLPYLIELTVDHNTLSGTLPIELWSLTNLTKISLWSNQLEGEIPDGLANLVNLTHLDLDSNQFSGSIPAFLGNLTQLTDLWLSNNEFTGTIPPELGNLTNLTGLGMFGNQLSGEIPDELGNLSNLTELYLSENQLSGSIPSSLGNLNQLVDLHLEQNNLSGSVPASFGNMSGLEKLNLSYTNLSGTLPIELIQLQNLQIIKFNRTNLCMPVDSAFQDWIASIPEKYVTATCSTAVFTDCSAVIGIPVNECNVLTTLFNSTKGSAWYDRTNWLENNSPCTWEGVSCENEHIVMLDLSGNNLTGYIPTSIGNLPYMVGLYLDNNNLTGSIPNSIGNLTELWYLSLWSNKLSGPIPSQIGNLTNLVILDLNSNNLSGTIPSTIGNLQNLSQLWLSNNKLTGTIPSSIWTLTNLTHLGLGENQLTGELPSEIGSLVNLQVLFLGGNLLNGYLPNSLGNLTSLEELYLYDNYFYGYITVPLGNLTNLTKLYLYSNIFYGTPPVTNLTNLTELYIDGNYFDEIPEKISNLTKLTELGLSYNNFSEVPSGIGKLTNLQELWLNDNIITSIANLGTLTNLKVLSLSNNQLSGTLSSEIGNLVNLRTLYLEDNPDLIASLPASLTNLVNLKNFYFTDTDLCIPTQSGFQAWIAGILNVKGTKNCPVTTTITEIAPRFVFSNYSQYPGKSYVYGTGFQENSIIVWNGIKLKTNFVSETELEGTYPDYSLTNPRQVAISVYTSGLEEENSDTIWQTISASSPLNGVRLTTTDKIQFDWDDVPGATQYKIMIFSYSSSYDVFTILLTDYTTISDYFYDFNLKYSNSYYWTVIPQINSSWGNETHYSRASFKYPNFPDAPALVYPYITYTNNPHISFRWNTVLYGQLYELQISDSSSFSTSILDVNPVPQKTAYTTDVLPDGTYFWRVRATNDLGLMGSWSTIRSFTVDTIAPDIPKLSSPKNATVTDDTTPALTVTAASGSKQYRYQLSTTDTFGSIAWEGTGGVSLSTADQPYGVYYWRAKSIDVAGNESGWSDPYLLTITFQNLPADGFFTTDTTPTFTWKAVGEARWYELHIYNGDNSLCYTTTLGLVTTFTLPDRYALQTGKYTWKIGVNLGSSTRTTPARSLTITPKPLPAPVLTSPAGGNSTNDTTPTFTWNPVIDADHYEIWLDNSTAFTSREYEAIVDAANTQTTLETALSEGKYYWKLRTLNSWGVPGSWSAYRSIVIDLTAPAVPKLYTPKNNASTSDTTPSLVVTKVSGTKYYKFQLSTTSDFSTLEFEKTGTSTTVTVPAASALAYYDRYYWRAKTIDVAGNESDWSTTYGLVVTFQKTPNDPTYTTDTTPTFTWYAVSGAKGYKLTILDDETPIYEKELGVVTSYTVPAVSALAYDIYTWKVSVKIGENWIDSTLRDITITPKPLAAPVIISPAAGYQTNNQTPTFEWNAVTDAFQYEIWLDNSTAFTSREFETIVDAGTMQATLETELPQGKYYWKMRTINYLGAPGAWSTYRALVIDLTAPTAPKLVSPTNLATVRGTPKFTWKKASGAKYYQFQIISTRTSEVVQSPNTLTVTYYKPALLDPGTYTWQVRAGDAAGNWGDWCAPRTVTIRPAIPAMPGLISPTNGYAATSTPEFGWNTVAYGCDYQIQISTNSKFSNIKQTYTGTGISSYTAETLANGTYYWRVRAVNINGEKGAWSAIRSIKIAN